MENNPNINLKALFPPELKDQRFEETGFNKMGPEDRIRVLAVFRALAAMAQELPEQTVTGTSLFLLYLNDAGAYSEGGGEEESTAEQEDTYIHDAPTTIH